MTRVGVRVCTIDGCGKAHFGRGLCKMHHSRLRRFGVLTASTDRGASPEEKFWARANPTDGGRCWLWSGTINVISGYGYLTVNGRSTLAHRFAYELLVGPIPEGLHVDHVYARGCRSRHCVNPAHLEPVTQDENNRRAAEANRRTHCLHGHEMTPENTGSNGAGRTLCKQCNRDKARRWKLTHA